MTREEVQVVLAAAPASVKPIFLTAIQTGLRKSELFRLEWSDIDLERGYVLVSNKEYAHTKNYLNREIPMTNQISETFEQLKNGSQNGHGNVFVKPDGTPHRGWLRRPLWRIIKETGVKPFTLHDLRHTFASQLSDVRSGSTDCPKAHGAQQHRCNNDLCAPFARPLKSAIERLGTRFQ